MDPTAEVYSFAKPIIRIYSNKMQLVCDIGEEKIREKKIIHHT